MLSLSVDAIDQAVAHARRSPHEEVCGMFVGWNGSQAYMPCTNVATNPRMNFVIEPEQIAQMYAKFDLLVLFHSHPPTHRRPSNQDIKCFPSHYVEKGLILVMGVDEFVWYDQSGVLKEERDSITGEDLW